MCGNYESLYLKTLPSPSTVTKIFHTTFRGRFNHILHYPKISKQNFLCGRMYDIFTKASIKVM